MKYPPRNPLHDGEIQVKLLGPVECSSPKKARLSAAAHKGPAESPALLLERTTAKQTLPSPSRALTPQPPTLAAPAAAAPAAPVNPKPGHESWTTSNSLPPCRRRR